jgi:transcriptional antiterminator NusG
MSEPFIVGETIKIIEGPFNDFNGVIEEVNDSNSIASSFSPKT